MSSPASRRGSALLDVLMGLALLALNGLLIAWVFRLFPEPAPWYAWLVAALILPAEAVALGTAVLAYDSRVRKTRRSPTTAAPNR